jgi:hypothetical protein
MSKSNKTFAKTTKNRAGLVSKASDGGCCCRVRMRVFIKENMELQEGVGLMMIL